MFNEFSQVPNCRSTYFCSGGHRMRRLFVVRRHELPSEPPLTEFPGGVSHADGHVMPCTVGHGAEVVKLQLIARRSRKS